MSPHQPALGALLVLVCACHAATPKPADERAGEAEPRPVAEAAASAAVVAPPPAAPSTPTAAENLATEYADLSKSYEEAERVYFEPYRRAKSDEEAEKIHLDPEQEPWKVYVPKFQDLARRAHGTDAGVRALLWLVQHAEDEESGIAAQAAVELVTDSVDSAELIGLASFLRYGYRSVGEQTAHSALNVLVLRSPHPDVRAQAYFSAACIFMESARSPGGSNDVPKQMLVALCRDYPDSPAAKEAEHVLFALEHLQIGSPAPEIEATDVDGVAFKLSGYRGQVVVLDFWGFW
jgi:hypothetical protein